MASPVLEVDSVAKTYRAPDGSEVQALPPTSLALCTGEQVAIVGPSGSGKSTLLSIAGLLCLPDTGTVTIDGQPIPAQPDIRAAARAAWLGYVFQGFNLFDHLTAVENVAEGLRFVDLPKRETQARALDALARVGLRHRADHQPNHMSGGEQQRVAIARAIVKRPRVLLADEPTGNLDPRTAAMICDLLLALSSDTAVLVVTHATDVARRCTRSINLRTSDSNQ